MKILEVMQRMLENPKRKAKVINSWDVLAFDSIGDLVWENYTDGSFIVDFIMNYKDDVNFTIIEPELKKKEESMSINQLIECRKNGIRRYAETVNEDADSLFWQDSILNALSTVRNYIGRSELDKNLDIGEEK